VKSEVLKSPVTVIIPTLNEEKGIRYVLSRIVKDDALEIIVVDTSSDSTAKIAEKLGATVIVEKRKGYGQALQTGVENAKGEIVVYIDADGTYDPEEIPRLVDPILHKNFDAVLGNRLIRHLSPDSMTPLNRIGNILLSFIFRLIYRNNISDSQCGLRAIKKKHIETLVCKEHGMSYVTEQLIGLVKNGAKIKEVPVSYRPRIGTPKLVPWKDGLRILRTIVTLRW
jgi:glycosyltransferase involved in cell wall biosynthesis